MTENESKYGNIAIIGGGRGSGRTLKAHIDILQELEAYRAIGTVEELKSMKENGAFTGVELAQLADMQMSLKEYLAIGTIEEFQALKLENEELHCEIQAINATMDLLENEIRAKAIDEFAEKLSLEISESIIWGMLSIDCKNSVSDEIFDYVIDTSKKIAEQLKEGGVE